MKTVAIIFWCLSALIPILSFGSLIALARQNKRDGTQKGVSFIPFLALFLAIPAVLCGWPYFKAWPLVPAVFDISTLTGLYLPWVIWKEFISPRLLKPKN